MKNRLPAKRIFSRGALSAFFLMAITITCATPAKADYPEFFTGTGVDRSACSQGQATARRLLETLRQGFCDPSGFQSTMSALQDFNYHPALRSIRIINANIFALATATSIPAEEALQFIQCFMSQIQGSRFLARGWARRLMALPFTSTPAERRATGETGAALLRAAGLQTTVQNGGAVIGAANALDSAALSSIFPSVDRDNFCGPGGNIAADISFGNSPAAIRHQAPSRLARTVTPVSPPTAATPANRPNRRRVINGGNSVIRPPFQTAIDLSAELSNAPAVFITPGAGAADTVAVPNLAFQ